MRIATASIIVVIALACHKTATGYQAQELKVLPLDKSLIKARVDGKYGMLLRQIKIAEDSKQFSDFADFGYRTETTCGEYTNLPKGYWVYVYPYWYIWRDRVADKLQKRSWGPEQVTGKPDTPEPGDQQTAWASSTQDGSDEWLMLEYKTPVWAYALNIYETYNPGSVVRITAFTLDDREVEVWKRVHPAIPSTPGQIFRPAFTTRVLANRIKIHLASKDVAGWNEIDAVGLRGEDGTLQWATSAHASSVYGVATEQIDPRDEKIRQLEDENRRLKAQLERAGIKPTPGSGGERAPK
jgi:hypothetical protein